MDWEGHAEREERRYADALERMPADPDPRQRQLVRAAMAAGGAGLVRLMQGRDAEAVGWFTCSADRYRESWADAPPEGWGRLVGAVKARLLARDWDGAESDARWALEQNPDEAESPIGRYAAVLALLVLGRDPDAVSLTEGLVDESSFPPAVAGAVDALARGDAGDYGVGGAAGLRSFEERDEYLEDIPGADTVIVVEALAERRGIASRPTSSLLPSA